MNNAAQAKSLLGVADGSLKAISDMLLRQQSLALRSASDYLDADSRKYLNTEFQGLTSEIDRLSGSTEFNGIKLIDGSLYTPSAVMNTDTTIDTSSVNEKTITFGADIVAGTDDYMVTINGRKFGYAANSITSDVSVALGEMSL
jgi:flagellin